MIKTCAPQISKTGFAPAVQLSIIEFLVRAEARKMSIGRCNRLADKVTAEGREFTNAIKMAYLARYAPGESIFSKCRLEA